MNLLAKIEELNTRYHDIITTTAKQDYYKFKQLITELKNSGYKFKIGAPNIDFSSYSLVGYEAKLYERVKLMQLEKKKGIMDNLFMYAHLMRECEQYLLREILVSLCRKEIIEKRYFELSESNNWINFYQSGHWIDWYIMAV
ncbi:hypothetical protein CJD36_011090 [Flavipsychrobacter stenotrophus]|uniref:Uncharacterized protein n=1 Tax=Flavipsychrobacter stenotrophus TaxID=2077091 RepID=A0A2S7SUD8_9BACT|nr:hypothetical protein [Flavipsychrobacter stenotrophus]PQJ10513.1 hypothetical protein CJD36_011090 [Flavipsychrobacter stenotrophus]